MKAFLIDPFKETVTEVQLKPKDYRHISKHLECDFFTVVYPPDIDKDVVYVDDEGIYIRDQKFFMFKGVPTPLAGYGLVVGTNESSDSCDPVTPLADIISLVDFEETKGIRWINT